MWRDGPEYSSGNMPGVCEAALAPGCIDAGPVRPLPVQRGAGPVCVPRGGLALAPASAHLRGRAPPAAGPDRRRALVPDQTRDACFRRRGPPPDPPRVELERRVARDPARRDPRPRAPAAPGPPAPPPTRARIPVSLARGGSRGKRPGSGCGARGERVATPVAGPRRTRPYPRGVGPCCRSVRRPRPGSNPIPGASGMRAVPSRDSGVPVPGRAAGSTKTHPGNGSPGATAGRRSVAQ